MRVYAIISAMLLKRWLVGNPIKTAHAAHERLSKTSRSRNIFIEFHFLRRLCHGRNSPGLNPCRHRAVAHGPSPSASPFCFSSIVLTISYRQIIYEYPEGGGAYIVARSNLGEMPALIAAAALMIDYVLTVAVSVAAGFAAITSAIPELFAHREALGLISIVFIVVVNLRGIRESGKFFAIPTYFAIGALGLMVLIGTFRSFRTGSRCPRLPSPAGRSTLEISLSF